jgi:hypothetical protein
MRCLVRGACLGNGQSWEEHYARPGKAEGPSDTRKSKVNAADGYAL